MSYFTSCRTSFCKNLLLSPLKYLQLSIKKAVYYHFHEHQQAFQTWTEFIYIGTRRKKLLTFFFYLQLFQRRSRQWLDQTWRADGWVAWSQVVQVSNSLDPDVQETPTWCDGVDVSHAADYSKLSLYPSKSSKIHSISGSQICGWAVYV